MAQIQQKRVQKRKLAEVSALETHVAFTNSTKQNQITEEKQSFALVQTLLLASVSSQVVEESRILIQSSLDCHICLPAVSISKFVQLTVRWDDDVILVGCSPQIVSKGAIISRFTEMPTADTKDFIVETTQLATRKRKLRRELKTSKFPGLLRC